MHRHTDWLTHRQTDGHKKERQSKTLTLLSMDTKKNTKKKDNLKH